MAPRLQGDDDEEFAAGENGELRVRPHQFDERLEIYAILIAHFDAAEARNALAQQGHGFHGGGNGAQLLLIAEESEAAHRAVGQ